MNWKQQLAEHLHHKSFDELNTSEQEIANWIEKNVAGVPRSVVDDDVQFKQCVRRERNAFVKFINELGASRPLRTACEQILIVYDQMRDRLYH